MCAVGDDDRFGAAGDECLGGKAAHFAGAEDHDLAVFEVPEDFFGEGDGDVADGGGAFLDGCLGADFFADAEGFLEKFVEGGAGGAGSVGSFVGLFYLAEDFGFTEEHGVEAADDFAEMAGDLAGVVAVEGFCVAGDFSGEGLGELLEGFLRGVGSEVVFGAVAGGEDEALGGACHFDEVFRGFTELGGAYGELLPDSDGCGLVVYSEADEFHFLEEGEDYE